MRTKAEILADIATYEEVARRAASVEDWEDVNDMEETLADLRRELESLADAEASSCSDRNPQTDEHRIRELLPTARERAQKAGTLHALWDVIADAEAFLQGRETLMKGTREHVAERLIRQLLE